jgi:hypothetical protein
VKPEEAQEVFYALTASALKTLSGFVASLLDASLSKLSTAPWTTLTEVGDQSAYVADLTRLLRRVFPVVRRRLDEAVFRSFADKFVRAFVARYQAAVYRAKRIGETGAQQLLLDAQAIKSSILGAPALPPATDRLLSAIASGNASILAAAEEEEEVASKEAADAAAAEGSASAPSVYVKFVQREMPRVELLLKIVSTPKDRFADTIKALWGEATMTELTRVMDLKNMAKKEQNDVLVALGLVKAGALSGLGFGMGGPAAAPAPAQASAGSAAGAAAAAASKAAAEAAAKKTQSASTGMKSLFGLGAGTKK